MYGNLAEYLSNSRITHDEFFSFLEHPLNAEMAFELIDGYINMMASPTPNHQTISLEISSRIHAYLKDKKCRVFQDLSVFLFDERKKSDNVFRPDIMVTCDKNRITEKGHLGAPDFVIEIVSKSTGYNDYSTKRRAYMRNGVKEYWIVDSLISQILVCTEDTEYKYTFCDKIESHIFEGLVIDFKEILILLDIQA